MKILFGLVVGSFLLSWSLMQYRHTPLWVHTHSAVHDQQSPGRSVLSCSSCLMQPHAKRGQMVSDNPCSGGAWPLSGFPPILQWWFKEHLICICLRIVITGMHCLKCCQRMIKLVISVFFKTKVIMLSNYMSVQ